MIDYLLSVRCISIESNWMYDLRLFRSKCMNTKYVINTRSYKYSTLKNKRH